MKRYEFPTVSFILIRQEDIISTSLQEGVYSDEMELVFSDIFT